MLYHPSTCSALRLRLSMAKLFGNYPGTPSPISTYRQYYSQLSFRKSRLTCKVDAFRTRGDASGIESHLKLNSLGISRGYDTRLDLPDYIAKRYFSQAPTNQVEKQGQRAKNYFAMNKPKDEATVSCISQDAVITNTNNVSEPKVKERPKTTQQDSAATASKPQPHKKGENNSEQINSVKSAAKSLLKPIMKQLYPATGRTVVVVESVTEAKVIQGYLDDMFEVLPSYGHLRVLPPQLLSGGSVRPDDDFSMAWQFPSWAWPILNSIKVALSGAENLILASHPDREGEAAAWHIIEMLHQQGSLHKDIHVARVIFHEITEASIKSALQAPREIDENLVHAYLARRALDNLFLSNMYPLFLSTLPGCQPARRLQSTALALVCDREMEIDEFKPQEYWSIGVELKVSDSSLNGTLPAQLTHFDSKKLDQFSISSRTDAEEIEKQINSENFQVISCKNPKVRKNPPIPYITSTLQQDAANILHFDARYTIKLARKLYEGVQLSDGKAAGLITYMITDGLHISEEAVKEIRSLVIERYGQNFVSGSPCKFFKKVKNVQEAHEAIRPTDVRRVPSLLKGILDEDSLQLYTLIWCRTVSFQMEPATIEQIQLDIGNASKSIVFRSSCSRVGFLGYQAVFEDVEAGEVKRNENEGIKRDEAFVLLNSMKVGTPLHFAEVKLQEHHTQPPSRYSESSLVKKLEELEIGRPATYARTLDVLQFPGYLTVKSRMIHPTDFRCRVISEFLCHHFSEVTDYSFNADMETELDNVSSGLTDWKDLLRDYWTRFSDSCARAKTVSIHQVEKMLEKKFGDIFFAALPDPSRRCPGCNEGTLIFNVEPLCDGYFIRCDAHPQCEYIAKILDINKWGKEGEGEEFFDIGWGNIQPVIVKISKLGIIVKCGHKSATVPKVKKHGEITMKDACATSEPERNTSLRQMEV